MTDIIGQFLKPIFRDDFFGDISLRIDYKQASFINKIAENSFIIWPLWRFKYDTIAEDVPYYPFPPNLQHFFGVDDYGRDIFAFLLYGYRVSILFGLLLSFIKIFIGFFVGALQGYFDGWVDIILQRFSEVLSAIPSLLILLIVNTLYKQNFWSLLLTYALLDWVRFANIFRLECQQLKVSGFILSAKSLGISNTRIILFQFIPNLFHVATNYLPFSLISSISVLVSFDFLGIGLPINTPSLGSLLHQASRNLHQPSMLFISVFFISITLVMIFMITENIQKTFHNHK